MAAKKTTAYKQKFNEQAYDRLAITIPKGQKAAVQAAADKAGESINQYTNTALLTRMKLSEWPEMTEGPKHV